MNKHNLIDEAVLHAIFSQYPEIQAVYLFGSTATGAVHAESDLDLAIVSEPSLYKAKLEILTELARQGFCQVDLLFLEKAAPVLRNEAVRQNRLLYATQDFDRGTFYSQVVRHYLDLLPYLKVQRDAYKSPALDIIHLLEEKGADVAYHDPYVPAFGHAGMAMIAVPDLAQAVQEATAL